MIFINTRAGGINSKMKRDPKRVLIVYRSLLLNETIKKAINHHEDMVVVAETIHPESIPQLVHQLVPDWILMIKQAEEALPPEIEAAMEGSQKMKLLTFATDGSKVKVFDHSQKCETLPIETLEQLVDVLNDPPR
jgi:hypothetical protein